jgi:hypothetical protein
MPDAPDDSNLPPPVPEPDSPLLVPQSKPASAGRPSSGRRTLAIILSICLGLYLIDGVVSLLDDTLIVCCGVHALGFFRGLATFFAFIMALAVYVTMAFTPLVPKRFFLPLTLSYLGGELLAVLMLVYFYGRTERVAWLLSLAQVIIGLAILGGLLGRIKWQWPLVTDADLGDKTFTWTNLTLFVLGNVLVLLPGILLYLAVCASLAIGHYSEGFVSLRPSGISMQMRKYVRNDGKTIELFPMSHVADTHFFEKVSESFPTNSVILLEGVSDEKHLLTNKISYAKLAKSLGLGEQHEDFKPTHGRLVRADIDIDQFSTNTIDLLNLVMLIHGNGMDNGAIYKIASYTPPPGFPGQLFDDLLGLRNKHLLEEIRSHLGETDNVVVPWGAAHMPGLAREIEKSGFRLEATRSYLAIPFHRAAPEKTSN